MIPEFAILGHPNEGKSSVLSTLAEDDSVKISPEPGETVQCRTFPVIVDGKEIIRFTDTPGFQNPGRMLYELQQIEEDDRFETFFQRHHAEADLHHDCELLRPLLRGAGIIYVADGSRPLRKVDLAEMEILRLTGKPRMAILNCKEDQREHLDQWKAEFRKHFNASRIFNAHNATYRERIRLLEALRAIEQDWQELLDYVVTTFQTDWQNRMQRSADIFCELLASCVGLKMEKTIAEGRDPAPVEEILYNQYSEKLREIEGNHHNLLRKLYKHNIYDYPLPPQSILRRDLFAEQTWEFLGLKRSRLAAAGGAGGAALAAGIDLAAGGASLGLFTAIGGAAGALGAVFGSRKITTKVKVLGISAAQNRLQIGPNTNPQFPYILLDRALLYYSHLLHRAHGRRDDTTTLPTRAHSGIINDLPKSSLSVIEDYTTALRKGKTDLEQEEKAFKQTIIKLLAAIAGSENESNGNGDLL